MVLGIILLAISGWSGLQLASGQPDEKTALQALLVSAAVAVGIGSLMWFTSRTPLVPTWPQRGTTPGCSQLAHRRGGCRPALLPLGQYSRICRPKPRLRQYGQLLLRGNEWPDNYRRHCSYWYSSNPQEHSTLAGNNPLARRSRGSGPLRRRTSVPRSWREETFPS